MDVMDVMDRERFVRVQRHGDGGHVAELVLDRPESLNAISAALAGQLAELTRALAADPRLRAVVLSSSAARAFSAGADLKERNRATDDELRAQREVLRAGFTGVLDLPVPAIAAVEGFALGGGLELALNCDLIVADRTAVLGLPETRVGVVPGGGGTQLLTRRLGWSRAAGMIFTGRRVDAAEAHRIGLVDELVETGTARAAALGLAATIAAGSPVAVRAAKRAMRHGLGLDLPAALEIEDAAWRTAAFSADRAEGVRAFVQRRPPVWPG